jgi:hypothetical protein
MSSDFRPSVLPQLVEERKLEDVQDADIDLGQLYYTTNSSSSDIGSPLTPTFSSRGHLRCSSSVSSLDLPTTLPDRPLSPSYPAHSTKIGVNKLPDVVEEPVERDEHGVLDGLYDCLCMSGPTLLAPAVPDIATILITTCMLTPSLRR